ncbi:MAG: hypothetical protein KDE25_02790 [Novosphingobium sp.]|nr:hypothetical protein [Novosphingobium sp.]
MRIKIKGEMTLTQLRQCIYEQFLEIEDRFCVRHARGVSIYLTPTDGHGEEVRCRDGRGDPVDTMFSDGPYPCAADSYDI